MDSVKMTGYGSTVVINYNKYQQPFLVSIKIQPVTSIGEFGETYISHLLGIIEPVLAVLSEMPADNPKRLHISYASDCCTDAEEEDDDASLK